MTKYLQLTNTIIFEDLKFIRKNIDIKIMKFNFCKYNLRFNISKEINKYICFFNNDIPNIFSIYFLYIYANIIMYILNNGIDSMQLQCMY